MSAHPSVYIVYSHTYTVYSPSLLLSLLSTHLLYSPPPLPPYSSTYSSFIHFHSTPQGLAAWAGYVVVALACGLAAYRFKLPMTLRSSLFPILGAYTWGWIGDVIDGFTIVVTVAGVCTSLGLGAMQIMAGLQRVGWVNTDITEEQREKGLIAVIWVVTLIATASVVSGLNVGIKHLSNIAFYLGQMLVSGS